MFYELSTWKTCAYMSKRKNRIFMKKTKKYTVIRKSIAFMLLFQLVFAFIGGETINNKNSIHETNSVGEYKSSLKDSKSNELGPKDALNQKLSSAREG